jgi:short-subunit dehydrogenase
MVFKEIPMQEIKNNFETNFFGPIAVMQAVLPQMRVQQSGLIINTLYGLHGIAVSQYLLRFKGALELVTESAYGS